MPDDTIEFSPEQREELRVMLAEAADVPVPRRAADELVRGNG